MRGIFFDEDDARGRGGPARRGTGTTARVVRERLAGEDDDEDHPWAVLTDAPEIALELLVDEYDGWLDLDAGPRPPRRRRRSTCRPSRGGSSAPTRPSESLVGGTN